MPTNTPTASMPPQHDPNQIPPSPSKLQIDLNTNLLHHLPRHPPRLFRIHPHTPFPSVPISTPERQQAASIRIGKLLKSFSVIAKRLAIWSIGEATAVFAKVRARLSFSGNFCDRESNVLLTQLSFSERARWLRKGWKWSWRISFLRYCKVQLVLKGMW